MADFSIVFIGFGKVGKAFARMLIDKRETLERLYGIRYKVVGISDIKYGSVVDDEGLDLPRILEIAERGGKLDEYPRGKRDLDSLGVIEESDSNLMVEVTWTNVETGEPALTHIRKALTLGKHVITTNKGPVAVAYKELIELAKRKDVFFRFEGTVLSGTPAITFAKEALAGCRINEIMGILNGTTNYILTEMEKGLTYEEALRRAQQLGYAEADPTADVEGWDAAAKAVILANTILGGDLRVRDVERKGIVGITRDDIRRVLEENCRIKLLAKMWSEDGKVKARVRPEKVPLTHPLANVIGVTNAVTFRTDHLGEVTVVGPGAGPVETAQALLMDMIAINNYMERGTPLQKP